MQAIKKAKERHTIRLRDIPASDRSAATGKIDKITIADVDGRTDEEAKFFADPMSILDHLRGLDDFKAQIKEMIVSANECRAQARPLGTAGSWIFLGSTGTGDICGIPCCAAVAAVSEYLFLNLNARSYFFFSVVLTLTQARLKLLA
jgi:hypothetical protein